MTSNSIRSVFLASLCLGPLPGAVWSQDLPSGQAGGQDITVVMETRAQRGRLRVAVPDPDSSAAVSTEARTAAALFADVLRADLGSSGVFVVQGSEELAILARYFYSE